MPTNSPGQIITIVKSFTAREIFKKHSEIKEQLWGGEFWTDGYFVNTVSKLGDESTLVNRSDSPEGTIAFAPFMTRLFPV